MRLTLQAPPWATAIASDLTDMDRAPEQVTPGERLEYELPDDVYFQYAFADEGGKLRPDPANDDTVRSVFYGEVSFVTGPDYRQGELADPPDDLATGETARLRLAPVTGDGDPWRVSVYTPADADGELPLVVVQDGVAFNRIGKVHLVAEALRAAGQARAARFAFIEPHDREREYGYDEGYQRFLAERLEEELTARYPTSEERVYLGASLGAVASAQAAVRRVASDPGLAARTTVLAYSGAFKGSPDDRDYYRSESSWLLEQVRSDRPLPSRWHLEVGTLEWLLEVNRQITAALDARSGVEAELAEHNAGHNWPSWKDGLAAGLRFALASESR